MQITIKIDDQVDSPSTIAEAFEALQLINFGRVNSHPKPVAMLKGVEPNPFVGSDENCIVPTQKLIDAVKDLNTTPAKFDPKAKRVFLFSKTERETLTTKQAVDKLIAYMQTGQITQVGPPFTIKDKLGNSVYQINWLDSLKQKRAVCIPNRWETSKPGVYRTNSRELFREQFPAMILKAGVLGYNPELDANYSTCAVNTPSENASTKEAFDG